MPETTPLLQNVRRSLAVTYDVLGHAGAGANGAPLLLGRELATKALVAIVVNADAADASKFTVDIQPELGKTVTVEGSMCPECRTPLPELDAFCFHCGANLAGSIAAPGTPESEVVLSVLEMATEGRYEILGRLDRVGKTAAVYFARDIESDHIVALRLKRVAVDEAVQPEYLQKLKQVFDTGELQAEIAQRKAQQAEIERAAAERAAAERVAAERVAAERVAAERVAAERVAAERAAAERVAAERVAAERAAKSAAAERAAAESAAVAYTPPPTADHWAPETADPAPDHEPASQSFTPNVLAPTADATPLTMSKTVSITKPAIGILVVALLAVVGYFAIKSRGDSPPVATNPAASVPVVAQTPVDSVQPTAPVAIADTSAAIGIAPVAATTSTDSGTIRVLDVPADARITVDGRSMRGRLLRVTARAHQLTVTAKGFEPFKERVTVASGATVRWAPKLVAIVVATTPTNIAPPLPAPGSTSVTKKSCRELMRVEDWSTARETCATEADAGNGFAAASMGRLYAKGLGVKRDAGTAVTWYRKGATAGDQDAQSFMGYALRDGNGVKRDDKVSAEMFKLAAEGGEKSAQLEYAVALEKGDGVAKNQASAREWYKKAADQGVFMAARRLGRMFEKGDGGPKSEPEALAAYERAATLGDAESAMTAGKWYRDGHGVAPSPAQALKWFNKALQLGNKDAEDEIKKLKK